MKLNLNLKWHRNNKQQILDILNFAVCAVSWRDRAFQLHFYVGGI